MKKIKIVQPWNLDTLIWNSYSVGDFRGSYSCVISDFIEKNLKIDSLGSVFIGVILVLWMQKYPVLYTVGLYSPSMYYTHNINVSE